MKTVILYFSGTGNSLAMAKELREYIEESHMTAILSSESKDIKWDKIDKAIFVYPIYMNYMPAPVESFIEKVNIPDTVRVHIVATHGGTQGFAGVGMVECFTTNEIVVNGYYEVEMINNTPKGVAPKMLMRLEWEKDILIEKVQKNITRSADIIKTIASSISRDESGILESAKNDVTKFQYKIMKLIRKLVGNNPPKLNFVLGDTCTGCGNCEKVCLADRIAIENNQPKWKTEHCYYCYACFNYCPTQAIGVKHYTKKMGRYHHPDVTVDEIANQKQ